MSDMTIAILDAAERRIRDGGYNGFSYREIAADVGIKASSVHYHFPGKELLAAAVARRYTDRFIEAVAAETASGTGAANAWRGVFRRALVEDGRMCLCGTLGAAVRDLPHEVVLEVQRFVKTGLDALTGTGMPRADAMRTFAMLEGAMLLANVLGDVAAFDLATSPPTG